MRNNKDFIKQLIAEDRLGEAIDVLQQQMSEYLSTNSEDDFVMKLTDTLVINKGKLNGLIHDKNIGILNNEEVRIIKAEVQSAVLYIISRLPKKVFEPHLDFKNMSAKIDVDFQEKEIFENNTNYNDTNINSQDCELVIDYKGDWFAFNWKFQIYLDDIHIGEGNNKGMRISFPTKIGRHKLKLDLLRIRSQTFDIEILEPCKYHIKLIYSRIWGNFKIEKSVYSITRENTNNY
jgi:hypothetical protein